MTQPEKRQIVSASFKIESDVMAGRSHVKIVLQQSTNQKDLNFSFRFKVRDITEISVEKILAKCTYMEPCGFSIEKEDEKSGRSNVLYIFYSMLGDPEMEADHLASTKILAKRRVEEFCREILSTYQVDEDSNLIIPRKKKLAAV